MVVQFKGYTCHSSEKWSDLTVEDFEPKAFKETDIEIAITHCGVCGSDVHTLTGGWGEPKLPLIVGHEIIGKATRVGKEVKSVKVGDRVGVGAQIGSCKDCRACKSDNENYCPSMIDTYNSEYADGIKTMGGFSTAIRADELFVFPIPDKLESKDAASMLCGGLTVYSPLVRNGCGPGKKIGIVGLGGLGHYAVMFAKALGAEVTVFSHSSDKEDDAKKLGASHFVLTTKKDWAKSWAQHFDLIVSTRDVAEGYPLQEFMSCLWVNGRFITVGIPDTPLPQLKAFDFIPNGCMLGGSHIGSKKECLEMLDLAAKKGLKPMIEEMSMKDLKQALENVKTNKVRYRYVLKQDIL